MLSEAIKHIVIVGGGTAGWMAANLLAHQWPAKKVLITLIESRDLGTIGVGEGSTPYLRDFFHLLGIAEQEWMPACNATFKTGIRFPGWSTVPGYESYVHPFYSPQDRATGEACFRNACLRRRGIAAPANPQDYFLAAELARQQRAPLPRDELVAEGDYAYHFDANLLGRFLQQHAAKLGVRHLVDTVAQVKRHDTGDLASLRLASGQVEAADFFIDCSGFSGLLISQVLEEPFISYRDNLFNDRAVALSTALDNTRAIPSETVSTALQHGWAWQIPLANRMGNGYVYSSDFVDADTAEAELRRFVGPAAADQEARHLQMRVGRVAQHWRNNCLAVGLSQGFIEPLEATALMLVQLTISHFIKLVEKDRLSPEHQQSFNRRLNNVFDGVRDYVVAHYKTNSRYDTDYWRANRDNRAIPTRLASYLEAWDNGLDFEATLMRESETLTYFRPSWYCLLAGMGRFPTTLQAPSPGIVLLSAAQGRARCAAMAKNFPDHRDYLMSLYGERWPETAVEFARSRLFSVS